MQTLTYFFLLISSFSVDYSHFQVQIVRENAEEFGAVLSELAFFASFLPI